MGVMMLRKDDDRYEKNEKKNSVGLFGWEEVGGRGSGGTG